MSRMTYTPKGGTAIDIGRFAPGLTMEVEGKWAPHVLPGQRGQLMEDLGDGALMIPVQLIFVEPKDYEQVVPAISKTRRGKLLTPRRGTKNVILRRIREENRWTERGDTTIVDLQFEEASLNTADEFRQGPSVFASGAKEQAQSANTAATSLTEKYAKRAFSYSIIALRKLISAASYLIGVAAAAGTDYAEAALQSYSRASYDPALLQRLQSLPATVAAAQTALRRAGRAQDTYAADIALERMLYNCTQLDAAIRAAQPVPIETEVTRAGGQSIYAFVSAHYATKQPSEMRELARLILRINRNIRRPDLIPQGTIVVRPSS